MAMTDPEQVPRIAERDPAWHGIDPTQRDARRVDDPFPSLHELRRVAPVNETPLGFFRLTRYADCVRLLREVPCGVRRSDGTPTGLAMGGRPEGGQFMLQQDPPAHTRLRKLVSKSFTPRATERWRPRVREIAAALVAPCLEAGRMDVVADLALPLPSTLICEMLGVPAADRPRFTIWTAQVTHLLAGDLLPAEERTRAEAAAGELAVYFTALLEERRQSLRDDLLSHLIRAEEEGDRLSPDELLVQSIGLLVAGFETTVGLIALGAKNLILHPGELAKLRERPALVESAVEECLRFEGPIGATTRVLHADATFGDRVIPKDRSVWAMIWAANRDPERFPDPDRFDVARGDAGHLAFGGGVHHCLGAHLARMEAQEALAALVTRTRRLAREWDRIAWGPSLFRVPARLEVGVAAA
jgi:cytochrome P450